MGIDQQNNRQKEGRKTEVCLGLIIQPLSTEKGANIQKCDLSGPGSTQSTCFKDAIIRFSKPNATKHLNQTLTTYSDSMLTQQHPKESMSLYYGHREKLGCLENLSVRAGILVYVLVSLSKLDYCESTLRNTPTLFFF